MILAMIFLVDLIFHLGIQINFLCQLIYLTSKGYAQEELFTGVLENCVMEKIAKLQGKHLCWRPFLEQLQATASVSLILHNSNK